MLGTLVEIGVPLDAEHAMGAAFEAIEQVQRLMSVFEAGSDLARANAAQVGEPIALHPWTAEVLALAQDLQGRTDGLFDATQGSGGWLLQARGSEVCVSRTQAGTRLDLGGLAKGWAVDMAVEIALQQGAKAVWVNAGGDLRVQGLTMQVSLRDELGGGVRPWLELEDGAVATSDFGPQARARLAGALRQTHLSVVAPRCAWADALTKILAQQHDLNSPFVLSLLDDLDAQVHVHEHADYDGARS